MNFKPTETVFELANNFINNSHYVKMNYNKITLLAEEMKKQNFKIPLTAPRDLNLEIIRDILKNSINYCYWYGRHDIRPNESCASKLGNIVDACFEDKNYENSIELSSMFTKFLCKITEERFPLIEERSKHLKQILPYVKSISDKIIKNESLKQSFWEVICISESYGSDLFLKRACLLFIELYRKYEYFRDLYKDELKNFPVPADYQVPKILEHFSCIIYSKDLKRSIEDHQLISKHSIQECEIRSATVLACKKLCDLTGWTIAEVDWWLWSQRDSVTTPFHLTITTDY